jgi:hypothetical protein
MGRVGGAAADEDLYVGAAGVIWALDALRRRGHAATSLDLPDAALRTLELENVTGARLARTISLAGLSRSLPVLESETVWLQQPRVTGARQSARQRAKRNR